MRRTFIKTIGLAVAVVLSFGSGTAIAAESTISDTSNAHIAIQTIYSSTSSNVIVDTNGVSINGVFYTQEEFREALDHAILLTGEQSSGVSTRATIAAAGIYFIPGIGEVAIAATGVILVGGAVIATGSWLWNTISSWLSDSRAQKIAKIRASILASLRKSNGDVDLSNFTTKLKNGQGKKATNGWKIDKDKAGHGGKKWKLKNKKGDRVASLGENGEVLGE